MYANPQIVRFCNQTVRPLADDITRLAVAVSVVMQMAQAQGILTTLQGVDPIAVIDDGSATDGRPPVTVGQLIAFLTECQKAHNALDTTSAVSQALAIQVNGYTS